MKKILFVTLFLLCGQFLQPSGGKPALYPHALLLQQQKAKTNKVAHEISNENVPAKTTLQKKRIPRKALKDAFKKQFPQALAVQDRTAFFNKIIKKNGTPIRELGMRRITLAAPSPDERFVSVSADNDAAAVINTQTGKRQLFRHDSIVTALAWSVGSQMMAVGLQDGVATIWDRQIGKKLRTFNNHSESSVDAVAVSPHSRFVATGLFNGNAVVWDMQTEKIEKTLKHTSPISTVAWSPDEQSLLVGLRNGKTYIWDVKKGESQNILNPHKFAQSVRAAAWSPDGQRVLTASDTRAFMWDAKNGDMQRELQHNSTVECVAWSPDSKWMATGSSEGRACVWHAQTGDFKGSFTHIGCMCGIAWSHASSHLITSSEYCMGVLNVSHFVNENLENDSESFKQGSLQPAQYILMRVLDKHAQAAHAEFAYADNNEQTIAKPLFQHVATAAAISLKDALHALMLFNPGMRTMILNAYRIDEGELEFILAQQALKKKTSLFRNASTKALLKEYVWGGLNHLEYYS